jgi:glycosyltransferase involved in cell wall biosynthesis
MAAGRPVVATRTGGTEELVTDEETGFLVPSGDAAALADRVGRLSSDAGLRAEMGRSGRARIEAAFSVETMVSRTMSLYDEVLG